MVSEKNSNDSRNLQQIFASFCIPSVLSTSLACESENSVRIRVFCRVASEPNFDVNIKINKSGSIFLKIKKTPEYNVRSCDAR